MAIWKTLPSKGYKMLCGRTRFSQINVHWNLWVWPSLEIVFADVTELRWGSTGRASADPKPNRNVVLNSREVRTQKASRDGHCLKCTSQGPPGLPAPPETGRGEEWPSPRAFGEGVALLIPWLWASPLPNCESMHSSCSKSLSVWSFVIAAVGN